MFSQARLKLTAWYLAIIMMVTLVFSLIVYNILMREVARFALAQRVRIERRWAPFGMPTSTVVVPDPDLVEELRRRIIFLLVMIDAGILITSGILGYFLAGRTLAPIQTMVDEQNRFISDASHELKTPLTSLKTSMEVFLRDRRPKLSDAHQVVSEGLEEIGRLQSLSESLLQLAHYQAPGSPTKFEQVSTSQIVSSAIKKVRILAEAKKIKISVSDRDLTLRGNHYSLVDLIVILLDNAIKYTPAKGNITLQTKSADHSVQISVTDTGPGIDPKDQAFIFDRFYRTDSARKKSESGGYGLGLAIAKKITESHHGTISVSSRPGKGSTFTVKIPRGRTTSLPQLNIPSLR